MVAANDTTADPRLIGVFLTGALAMLQTARQIRGRTVKSGARSWKHRQPCADCAGPLELPAWAFLYPPSAVGCLPRFR